MGAESNVGTKKTLSRGRYRATRAFVVLGMLLGLVPFTASPAVAAQAATASVNRTTSFRAKTYTYTFTVTNSSTAGEGISSARITRPSVDWNITACPQAPAGWTGTPSGGTQCVYNSAVGTADDIPAGGSQTFQVTGAVAPGTFSEEGVYSWRVEVDSTDTFIGVDGSILASGGSALLANVYVIEIIDVVVETVATASGSPCPAASKKAPAGSSRVLTVCGLVHAQTSFTAKGLNSAASGTFIGNQGNFQGMSVPPSQTSIVLGTYPNVTVTPTVGTGLTITTYIGNAPEKMLSPPTTLTGYTTDVTPPVAPPVPDLVATSDSGSSSTDDITNDNTPTFSGTAEPNSTVEIMVGGAIRATTTADATGAYTATVPGASPLADGNRSITARATDPSGNVGPESAALAVVIDTTAPIDPPIGTRPGTWGADDTPTWSFTTEPNARVVCKIVFPDSTQTTDNTCASPKTFDISAGSDGSYTFRVSQTDVAGNLSNENTDGYLLDRQPPTAPTINTRPANVTSNPSVGWTFSGESNARYECVLVRPDQTEVADAACVSPKSFALNTRPDGLYTFKVRQFDLAGQPSPFETDSFTLDRQGPSAPTITEEPEVRTSDFTPTWNFTGEAGGSFECELVKPDGATIGDPTCSGPKGYDLDLESDGLYTFKVRQLDDASNPGSYASSSFTLDRQAPAAPTITGRPANFTSDEDPAWTFTGEFGASYECVLVRPDNTEISSVPCASPQTFALSGEADGVYMFKVRQTDVAGNPGPYATDDFTLDRIAPAAPSIENRPAERINNPTASWNFSGEANAAFECVLVRPDLTEITDSSCAGPKSYDLDGEVDGLYTFKVRQTDQAGFQGPFASDTFTLDREAPAPPTITEAPPARTNDLTPRWDFTGELGGSFECVLVKPGGAEVTDASCAGPKGYDLTTDPDGLYTFKVRQTDDAGTTGSYGSSTFTLDRQAPVAPSISARPSNVTANENPSWTFSGEFGASYDCVLVRPDDTEINSASCGSPKSSDLTTEADGTYTFKVRQVDVAGNPGPYATDQFTLDRTAPLAPSIDSRPPEQTNVADVDWSFSGETGATFECVLVRPDLSEIADASCVGSKNYNLGADPDGLYTFKVRQLDVAGNPGPYATDTFTLDRVAPAAPSITARPPDFTTNPSPEWSFTGEFGASYECLVVRPNSTEITAIPCASPNGFALAAEADGAYIYKVRQIDMAGNPGPYATDNFTLDRQAPIAPAITVRPANVTANQTPSWTFTGESGASYECVLVRSDNSEITAIPCTSPRSFSMNAEADGAYTFKVRQIDRAGLQSPYATDDFTLDRQAPAAPSITSRPPEEINNPSVAWEFTGETSATYGCVLVRPNLTEITDTSCTSIKNYDLSSEPDGFYTFKVRQTDLAGLQSGYATDTFTLDRQAPNAPTITEAPVARTNDATVRWNFTGESGGTYECILVKPGGAETSTSNCSRPKDYDLTSELDGLYTFKVRQFDGAGSPGPYATSSFTLDRQAPTAPVIGTRPSNSTNDPDPQWTFTGEFGASYECALVRPNGSAINTIPCGSPISYALASQADGAYTFRVRQIDVAGNPGPYATDDFILDRVAPDPPSITSRPNSFTNDDTPTWAFVGDGSPPFECTLVKPDGTPVEIQPCYTPATVNLSAELDGTYTFRVRQLDDAGNKSVDTTDTFTLDRQAPVAPAITAAPPARTNDATPEWNFSGEFGATFHCVLVRPDGSQVTAPNCTGPKGYDLSALADGLYTFRVRQTDRAGNTGPYATSSFTLDRQAPVAPAITSRPADFTPDQTPEWTFTGEFGASFECILVRPDGTEISTVPCASPATFTLGPEADGMYTFKVRQIDAAGNPGPYLTDSFTLDRQAPVQPSIDSRPAEYVNDPAVGWTFSGEANATFECVIVRPDSSEITDASCTSPKNVDLGGEADGLYTFKVRQTDQAGLTGPYLTDTFTLDRVAPVEPTVTEEPADFSTDSTPRWSFTGEPEGSFECILTKPGGAQITTTNCTSPSDYDFGNEVDGLYTFRVRQIDNAGTPGPYTTSTYTLDRIAPSAPAIDSRPADYVNDPNVSWAFSGEPNATYECVLVRPNLLEITDTSCTSLKSYNLTAEFDGLYTFKVRQTDQAGQEGPFITDTFTLDRQAPAAPSITNRPVNFTPDETPEWTFTGEAGASYECSVIRADNSRIDSIPCGSPKIFNLAAEADGAYTFRVRQIDRAGNPGPYATDDFTLDRVAPVAPVIDARPAEHVNDPLVGWDFSGEANAVFECVLVKPDNSEVADTSCASTKNYDLSGDPDGLYTFKVRQTDQAGWQGPFVTDTFTLDREAPAAPAITSRPAAFTPDENPSWSFTGEFGASYECVLVRADDSEITTAPCTSPTSFALASEADGAYTFKVRQIDLAGNPGPYGTDNFTLDRSVPEAPSIDDRPAEQEKNSVVDWAFSGEDFATYECVLVRPDATEITDTSCTSRKEMDLRWEADGLYTFKVRQTDRAGLTGPFATDTFTLDRKAPLSPTFSSLPSNFTKNTTPKWSFGGEVGGTYECVLVLPNGGGSTAVPCSSPKSFSIETDPDGLYTFKVRQTDEAGNTGPFSTDSFTLDRAAPSAPSLDDRPADHVNDATVEWAFSGEQGAKFECVLVKPNAPKLVADTSCTSVKAIDLGTEPDGVYSFKLRQADRAGQFGPWVSDSFELDRAAPGAPTITSQPDDISSDQTPEWSFTGDDDTAYECVLVKPGDVEVSDDCSASHSFDLAGDADGTYTFKVRQTDPAGNTSAFDTSTYVLDRQAPVKPTITATPQNYYDVVPEWSFTGEEGGTFECALARPDATEMLEIPCTSPTTFDLSSEPNGDYTFKVRQTDTAGNVGAYATYDHGFDKTPPKPQLAGGAPAATNDPTHEWSITGEPDAVFECTVIKPDGSETVDADCTSPYAVDLGDGEDGVYTLSVRQFIGVNGSLPTTLEFELDRTIVKPELSVQPGIIDNDASPTWTFSGETGSTFECVLVDTDGVETTEAGCQAPETRFLKDLPDGDHVMKVRQTDPAGNVSEWASRKYHLDRVAPGAPKLEDRPGIRTKDLTPAWSFSGEEDAKFNCTLTAPNGKVTRDRDCSRRMVYELDEVQGRYLFSVTQVDKAGNESVALVDKMKLDLKAPVATRLRIEPKNFKATMKNRVLVRFGRSEKSAATVIFKKGTKTLHVVEKAMGRTRLTVAWRTVLDGKPIKPGKYKVLVKLEDQVGLKSKVATILRAR